MPSVTMTFSTGGMMGSSVFCLGLSIHTLYRGGAVTTFGSARPGDPVNLEVDVIAKYVERLLEGAPR